MPFNSEIDSSEKPVAIAQTESEHILRSRKYISVLKNSNHKRGAKRVDNTNLLFDNQSIMFKTPPLNFGVTQTQKSDDEEKAKEEEAALINRRMRRQELHSLPLANSSPIVTKNTISTGTKSRNVYKELEVENSELLEEVARLQQKVKHLSIQNRPTSVSKHRILQSQDLDTHPSQSQNHNAPHISKKGSEKHSIPQNLPRKSHEKREKFRPPPKPSDDSSSSESSQTEEEQRYTSRRGERRREPPRNFRCEMDKWPIRFDGTSVQKFLKKLNRLQKSYDYSDETVAKYFHLLIEGKAVNWYWMYCEEYENIDLNHMKREMARDFKSDESDISLMTKMYERKQGNDSFEKFYYDILDINYTMTNPLIDPQIIEILKTNMDDEVRQRIFTYETQDRTKYFHKANKAYSDVCKVREQRRKDSFANTRVPRRIHEIDIEDLSNNEIEEFSTKIYNERAKRNNLTCFNCQSSEHLLRDCPEEITRFFCFKCGLDGYATPKCPKCSLNFPRSAENIRLSRSK